MLYSNVQSSVNNVFVLTIALSHLHTLDLSWNYLFKKA